MTEAVSGTRLTMAGHIHPVFFSLRWPDEARRRAQCYDDLTLSLAEDSRWRVAIALPWMFSSELKVEVKPMEHCTRLYNTSRGAVGWRAPPVWGAGGSGFKSLVRRGCQFKLFHKLVCKASSDEPTVITPGTARSRNQQPEWGREKHNVLRPLTRVRRGAHHTRAVTSNATVHHTPLAYRLFTLKSGLRARLVIACFERFPIRWDAIWNVKIPGANWLTTLHHWCPSCECSQYVTDFVLPGDVSVSDWIRFAMCIEYVSLAALIGGKSRFVLQERRAAIFRACVWKVSFNARKQFAMNILKHMTATRASRTPSCAEIHRLAPAYLNLFFRACKPRSAGMLTATLPCTFQNPGVKSRPNIFNLHYHAHQVYQLKALNRPAALVPWTPQGVVMGGPVWVGVEEGLVCPCGKLVDGGKGVEIPLYINNSWMFCQKCRKRRMPPAMWPVFVTVKKGSACCPRKVLATMYSRQVEITSIPVRRIQIILQDFPTPSAQRGGYCYQCMATLVVMQYTRSIVLQDMFKVIVTGRPTRMQMVNICSLQSHRQMNWSKPCQNRFNLRSSTRVPTDVAHTSKHDYSPPTKANRVQFQSWTDPDFREWESCLTMPLIGGFYRGSPVYPASTFRRCSILTSFHSHLLSKPRRCARELKQPPRRLKSHPSPTSSRKAVALPLAATSPLRESRGCSLGNSGRYRRLYTCAVSVICQRRQ
ncbi:hypothetical protein PR048_010385 [Dryococelus australis]|uniref:Uncharacterized protein n=1 Tax=Dryococelus australis TaxID=614101 RepID=A0ABQ9I2L7_9NEOP|nr:hypothetical protein PR048_010385 [Dryococelus australis]